MKRIIISIILSACFFLPLPLAAARDENRQDQAEETYTGTIMSMSGGMASIGFTLSLTGRTTDEEASNYRSILASEGQDDLMKAIGKNNLGHIAATGQTRRNLLVVREGEVDGKRRIIAAFERWQGFYEVRGGYRSMDYPFAIIEIVFDEKGRGTGTFIGLAQVGMKQDKKTEQMRLEIENFGSFPAKVMGVRRRK